MLASPNWGSTESYLTAWATVIAALFMLAAVVLSYPRHRSSAEEQGQEDPASNKNWVFVIALVTFVGTVLQIQWLASNKHVIAIGLTIQAVAAGLGVWVARGGRRLLRWLFITTLILAFYSLIAWDAYESVQMSGRSTPPVYVSGDKPIFSLQCSPSSGPIRGCWDTEQWRLAGPSARIDSRLRLGVGGVIAIPWVGNTTFDVSQVTTSFFPGACGRAKVDWTAWAGSAEVGHGTIMGRDLHSDAIILRSTGVVYLRISAKREDTMPCVTIFEITRKLHPL